MVELKSQPIPGSESSTSAKPKRKRARRSRRSVHIFEHRVQAIYAAKHAPDATSHSPDDFHVNDEAKPPRNDKTTALACSPDFISPAPEKILNTAAVSSPRDESRRKVASLRLRESVR